MSNPSNVYRPNEIAKIVGQCLYSVYPLVSRIFVTFFHNYNALAFLHIRSRVKQVASVGQRRECIGARVAECAHGRSLNSTILSHRCGGLAREREREWHGRGVRCKWMQQHTAAAAVRAGAAFLRQRTCLWETAFCTPTDLYHRFCYARYSSDSSHLEYKKKKLTATSFLIL